MSMQLACLFIGPSFVSAAISVVFKHIILYCGQQHSKLKAKWYPYVFIGTDFACILVQVAGGAISSLATTGDGSNMALLDAGSGLLIAGVAAQVVNMVGCGIIILHFIYSYRRFARGPSKQEQTDNSQYAIDKTNLKLRRNFNAFCWALFVAYVAVLIRCIYRSVSRENHSLSWIDLLMLEKYPGNGHGMGEHPDAERDQFPDS
jgi:hypothetical protein